MKYILSHPRLTKSAKPLARKLEEILGEHIAVFTTVPQKNNYQCVIRYGNSMPVVENVQFNSAPHIRLAGNKLNLSQLLNEKEFPHVEMNTGEPDEYPVVIRTELNRGGGIGIEIVESNAKFQQYRNNYWSYWYNFKFELGVHILGGKIERVFKKVREDELEEEKYPIRNTQRGYKFSLRNNWKDNYDGLEKFVAKLYEIVPIQFARLDVGYDKETGGYRLIEINSAPDLSQNANTLKMYAEFLAGKVR